MASSGEIIFEWAVGFVDECAAAGVELPPQVTRMLPYVDVVLWVRRQRKPPTWREIADRWNVCRATAYRWKRVLRASPECQQELEAHAWYQGLNQGPTR
ncbi:hypothetical protein [Xanthomonas theicola]|uniref:Uncharacterized protein n=1 Tax=Xanthomonas theicola TaxID=56464 RepID=A0A2S6ZLW4_9XANT|nr:hypothetical protein [Xanthomonas theicola]PPT93248.1 hypothetical protein XthCFBP4691_01150 [Xanthomonas theicola]QNH24817.1 hypothetical protein G4Q83_08750 [Xanthomonas theicola]